MGGADLAVGPKNKVFEDISDSVHQILFKLREDLVCMKSKKGISLVK